MRCSDYDIGPAKCLISHVFTGDWRQNRAKSAGFGALQGKRIALARHLVESSAEPRRRRRSRRTHTKHPISGSRGAATPRDRQALEYPRIFYRLRRCGADLAEAIRNTLPETPRRALQRALRINH